jgi:hypothetical protein
MHWIWNPTIPWYKQYHWQIFHEKKQEEVILKSTQFAVLHVLSKLIMLKVNCISFIIPIYKYIRCIWYKSNDVLHCVEIHISYIIILWYYVVFVDIWPFQKITVKKINIYWILSETCQHFYKFGTHWWVWPRPTSW